MQTAGLKFALSLLLIALVTGCSPTAQPGTQPTVASTPAPTTPAPATPTPTPAPTPAPTAAPITGRVFTMTNDSTANSVLVLSPNSTGNLALTATVPTGGKGGGGGLQNQAALALNEDRTLLFVVNPGSNDFSIFRVDGGTLTLVSRTPSGGLAPISISAVQGIVYLLNDGSRGGDADNISGFRFTPEGVVTPIPNSTRALSQASTGAAQVAISPAADTILVSERSTAILSGFSLDPNGNPGPIVANPSTGTIPFGFQFFAARAFVSEEGPNAVSSYLVTAGRTQTITRSERNFQAATCWLAITPSGKFLYTTNTSARSISAFSIATNGAVALIGSSGIAALATAPPIDAIVSIDGQFLHVVDAGGSLDTFRIAANGSLTLIQTLTSLGSALNGVVAA